MTKLHQFVCESGVQNVHNIGTGVRQLRNWANRRTWQIYKTKKIISLVSPN